MNQSHLIDHNYSQLSCIQISEEKFDELPIDLSVQKESIELNSERNSSVSITNIHIIHDNNYENHDQRSEPSGEQQLDLNGSHSDDSSNPGIIGKTNQADFNIDGQNEEQTVELATRKPNTSFMIENLLATSSSGSQQTSRTESVKNGSECLLCGVFFKNKQIKYKI